ncbi:MAG: IclR family transcriptional regulator [Alphaproteobacteria bacterium]|nr:IclR family transcriptional regulator [Alphaproteobacteria bacterium]
MNEAERMEKDRKFVYALARGLDILKAFSPDEAELSNLELSEKTGLPKPTVSRFTYTLTELGYLVTAPRTGKYRLGPLVLSLGYTMLASVDLRERAKPFMDDIARRDHVTVALGTRDKLSAVYIEVSKGSQIITISRNVGSRLPIHNTAMGKALIAALPATEYQYLLKALAEKFPEDIRAIEKSLETAREDIETQGFCTSIGEWIKDVNAVAAPLFSADRNEIYAINVGGPSFMINQERLCEELGPRLVDVVKALTPSALT